MNHPSVPPSATPATPALGRPIVDLVIPAYNEQDNIPALMQAIGPLVEQQSLRYVVVADNHSTDNTAQLAEQNGAIVVFEPARGYGSACLAGLAWIAQREHQPDMVAFLDADLSDDPGQIPRLCKPIAEDAADLVIGCRVKLAEPGALNLPQKVGNYIACWFISWLIGQRYTDLGPMRVIRYDALLGLAMQDRTWGWTVEMQYKAASSKLRIEEIDVPYRCRHAGKSKISGSVIGSMRAAYKITSTIFKLWWQAK